jgi:dolichol-phosphate mannosyltransferase
MDADLQHPPERLIDIITHLEKKEFVIGTRYAKGNMNVDKDWPIYRRIISQGARLLAYPLTALTDPMTGYFGVRREVYQRGVVSPIGFKICMEIFVKCNVKSHGEVPIEFGVRLEGESKLSSKVILFYLKHLWQLYMYKYPLSLMLVIALIIYCVFYLYVLMNK